MRSFGWMPYSIWMLMSSCGLPSEPTFEYYWHVKLTIQLQLLPNPAQWVALYQTLALANADFRSALWTLILV